MLRRGERAAALHVFDLVDGREVIPARPARELFDTRLVSGGAELLVTVEGGLERLRLRPGSDPVLTTASLATGQLDAAGLVRARFR